MLQVAIIWWNGEDSWTGGVGIIIIYHQIFFNLSILVLEARQRLHITVFTVLCYIYFFVRFRLDLLDLLVARFHPFTL